MGQQYKLVVVGRRGNSWLWDLQCPPTLEGAELTLWTRPGSQLHLDSVYTVTFQAKVSGTWQFVLPENFVPPSGAPAAAPAPAPPGAAAGAATGAAAAAVTKAAAAATTTAASSTPPFLVGQGYDLVVVAPRNTGVGRFEIGRPAGFPASEHLTLWAWPQEQVHLGCTCRLTYYGYVQGHWQFVSGNTWKSLRRDSATPPPLPGEPAAAPVQPAAPAASTAAPTLMAAAPGVQPVQTEVHVKP